jgi:HSP20 family protein
MVEEITRSFSLFSPTPWVPMADVYEDEDHVMIVVDLAGVDRDRLMVTVEGRFIQISGRRESPSPPGLMRIHQMEIDSGEFRRRIALSGAVSLEANECTYRDGLLRIVLPKRTRREVIRIPVETE